MRQRVTNLAGSTDMHIAFCVNLLFHTILTTMCLISHDDDVLTIRKSTIPIIKLLHGGKDDTA